MLASCHRGIDDADSDADPLPAEDCYTTFTLTDPGSDANAAVVSHGEERAHHGAAATQARFDELCREIVGMDGELKSAVMKKSSRRIGTNPKRVHPPRTG